MLYKCEASGIITRQIVFAEFNLRVSGFVFPILIFIGYEKYRIDYMKLFTLSVQQFKIIYGQN